MLKIIKTILLFIISLFPILSFLDIGKTTINLNDYVVITSSGYDSQGTVSYSFDYDKLADDYRGKIKIKKYYKDVWGFNYYEGEDGIGLLISKCVDMSFDKDDDLSNGETVSLLWKCDDNFADEYLDVKLKYSDIEYEVNGLQAIEKFNAFDYLDLFFSGTDPYGRLDVIKNNAIEEMEEIDYEIDKVNNLKNGDNVKITVKLKCKEDEFIEKYGKILEKKEEIFTVSDLPKYVTDISEIPTELYEKMNNQLKDAFESHKASYWNPNTQIIEFTNIGNYMLTCKEGMEEYPYNYLYYVYKVTINTGANDFSYYWYGFYTEIMILGDGNCTVDISNYAVSEASSSIFGHQGDYLSVDDNYYVAGFSDIESLFNKHIVSKIENYDYTKIIDE